MTEFPKYTTKTIKRGEPIVKTTTRETVVKLSVKREEIPTAREYCKSCPANLVNAPQPNGYYGLYDRPIDTLVQCSGVDNDTGQAKIVAMIEGRPGPKYPATPCRIRLKG